MPAADEYVPAGQTEQFASERRQEARNKQNGKITYSVGLHTI